MFPVCLRCDIYALHEGHFKQFVLKELILLLLVVGRGRNHKQMNLLEENRSTGTDEGRVEIGMQGDKKRKKSEESSNGRGGWREGRKVRRGE